MRDRNGDSVSLRHPGAPRKTPARNWTDPFLHELSKHGCIAFAAEAAGVTRQAVQRSASAMRTSPSP